MTGNAPVGGMFKSRPTETGGTNNAANLRRAHQLLASGKARGTIVPSGF